MVNRRRVGHGKEPRENYHKTRIDSQESEVHARIKHFRLYCLVIVLTVTLPILGTAVNYFSAEPLIREPQLNGVTTPAEKPVLSLDAVLSGEFQSAFESYYGDNLVTRKLQTMAYNQLLYTLFHTSDNSNVLVGRDDYIFEKVYASAYLSEMDPQAVEELEGNVEKAVRLRDLLKQRGVELIIRISPSKAEHYSESLPVSYDRFVKMKKEGKYGPNWYQAFKEVIQKTDIPVYDRYDLMEQLKSDGEIVFTKGGTHWTIAPMPEYINGLNEFMENLLGKKLGRLVVDSKEVIVGEMGNSADADIWSTCWNSPLVKPNYPSPHMSLRSIPGEDSVRVFTVGQSFTTLLINTIFQTEPFLWNEAYFSWYNTRVLYHPSPLSWGTQVSDKTDDYETYLGMDVILIDFIESGTSACQFEFVDHMLQYLEKEEMLQ